MSELVAPLTIGPTSRVVPAGGAAILTCSTCGGKRSQKSTTGLCFSCSMKARAPAPRYCGDCGKQIHRQNKSGFCHPCLTKQPEFHERRLVAVRKAFENPAHVEKMRKVIARNHAKARLEKPGFEEWLHSNGKRLAKMLHTPEMRAKTQSEETRHKLSKTQTEKKRAWCPPGYWEEYRRLIRSKRMHSSEARPLILAKAAAEELERRAMTHPAWQSVIDHMRRLTAVIRLDNGNYRVGTAELTPGQLLERAELRGYELPRWAA